MGLKQYTTKMNIRVIFFFLLSGLMCGNAFAQQETVQGTVTNSKTGEGIPGVNIIVQGTDMGTATGDDGTYSLSVPSLGDTLVFSFIGYKTEVISINGRSEINIALKPQTIKAKELVVVGYGTKEEKNVTGSVSSVSTEEVTEVPVGNVTSTLAGQLPGLTVVQRSGEPGSNAANLSIRGFGDPLIVVDGVPGRSLTQLDPKSIESITVLKDAASAAVYGVSAGNGVILVTTKDGYVGETELNYSFNYGLQHVTRYPEFVNSAQYAILKNESSTNQGGGLVYSKKEIKKFRRGAPGYPNFDYYDYYIDDYVPQIKQELTVSGGSEKVTYFFLLGHLYQRAMWEGKQYFRRFNARSNINVDITDNLSVSVKLSARYGRRYDLVQSSYLMASWLQYSWPIFKPKTPDGKIAATNYGLAAYLDHDLTGYINDYRRRYLGNLSINYEIPFIEGLAVEIMATRDLRFGKIKHWNKKYYTYTWSEKKETSVRAGSRGSNFLQLSTARTQKTHIRPSLHYKRAFFDKHNVEVLLLYDQYEIESTGFAAKRVGYIVPIDQIFAGPNLNKTNSGSAANNGRVSFVGRINYDYSGKYLLQYSFRYDASPKFPADTRWGYFQGISVGWRISSEPFFKDNLEFIDNLKIRASWGKLGNDKTGKFQYITGFSYPAYGYIFGRGEVTQGMVTTGIPNPNITWEISKTTNIGLDFSLWNGLLSGSIDAFNRNRSGMLATRILSLPLTFGASLPAANINSDNTKGFEIVLRHQNNIGQLHYQVSLNMSYTKSKWKHFEEGDFPNQYMRWVNGNSGRFKNRFFALQAIGQFQSWKDIKNSPIQDDQANSTLRPGDIKYEDFNHDGVIDEMDRQPIGLGHTPEIFYGANFSFSWKNWNLMFTLQGASNFTVEKVSFLIAPFYNGMNAYAFFMDRWHRKDMTDPESEWIPGKFPSTINSGSPNNVKESSFWLEDATYLRLKTLNLTYSLSIETLKSIGIEELDITLSGYNLLTFSGLEYIDPEAPSGRLSYYPQHSIYNVGINIEF